MKEFRAQGFWNTVFGCDEDAAGLSRRNVLAGLGLVGAVLAAPKLLVASAEATPLAKATQATAASGVSDGQNVDQGTQDTATDLNAETISDATDLSAQRWRWRRRRRYWRRRYWRPRVYRRRYWRRRYWRRRYRW